MRPWHRFTNSAKGSTLAIFDEIGAGGTHAADLRQQLDAIKAPTLALEINSPGGDVFAGIAIYNMLRASGKTIAVKVMGVAASAASLIAMAGDTIEMPENTFLMVHNPLTSIYGTAEDLRAGADVLDKIGESITATYVAKTGMGEAEMKALLAQDTWLTADEALAKGFATKVTPAIAVQASFSTARADLPANVKAMFTSASETPVGRSVYDVWAARHSHQGQKNDDQH